MEYKKGKNNTNADALSPIEMNTKRHYGNRGNNISHRILSLEEDNDAATVHTNQENPIQEIPIPER